MFDEQNVQYTRYDDDDLNYEFMNYTIKSSKEYKPKDDAVIYLDSWAHPWGSGGRKYWLIKKER